MNKRFYFIFILICFSQVSCSEKKKGFTKELAVFEIDNDVFDFGQMSLKDSLSFTFEIKNISETPLKISKVGTSCGCTTTNYTKDSVLINDHAKIDMTFKPTQLGQTEKSIVVEMNTKPPFHVFYIKGKVVE